MAKKQSKKTQPVTEPMILVLGGCRWPIEDAGGRVAQMSTGDDRAQEAIRNGLVQGLLLTGGGDVNPLLYADKAHRSCYGINDARDDAEWNAITAANEVEIPIMGICRGAQIINVAFGGTLHQNITDLETTHRHHNGGDHRVRAAEGSRLADAWGQDENATRWVISIHHQAVNEVADGFVATGWGLDGTIEAIESVEGWVLGVQFHPEMAHGDPHHQRIFDRFVAACAKHAGMEHTMPSHPDRVKGQPRKLLVAPTSTVWMDDDDDYEEITETALAVRNTSSTKIVKGGGPWQKERARRSSTWASPVLTKWRCFRCTIDFDDRTDHIDHMLFLHGVEVDQ